MNAITTYTKKSFDPIRPNPDLLDIADIAHSLSLLCRANGHFPTFYSVAQHCLACFEEARAREYSHRVQLACLLHDASEAYLSDITRPVKKAMPEYKQVEKRLETLIYEKWVGSALTPEEYALMREVDDAMLYHEFFHFMGEKLADEAPKAFSKSSYAFVPFSDIEEKYLHIFRALTM